MSFYAKQKIIDKNNKKYANEILYRTSISSTCFLPSKENENPSLSVINILENENLFKKEKIFFNIDDDFLNQHEKRLISLHNKKNIVFEILENSNFKDQFFFEKLCKLKKDNKIIIALDDVVSEKGIEDYLKISDYIKVDVSLIDMMETKELYKAVKNITPEAKILAEKIETLQQFTLLKNIGFDLFQGYYIGMPKNFRL